MLRSECLSALQNSHVGISTPNVTVLEGRNFGRGRALMNGINALIKETPGGDTRICDPEESPHPAKVAL